MELPAGYKIVAHPRTGIRFVQHPSGRLVPNQGTRPIHSATDQEIISDFLVWYRRNRPQFYCDQPGFTAQDALRS